MLSVGLIYLLKVPCLDVVYSMHAWHVESAVPLMSLACPCWYLREEDLLTLKVQASTNRVSCAKRGTILGACVVAACIGTRI